MDSFVEKYPFLNSNECALILEKVSNLSSIYQIEVENYLSTLGIALYQKKSNITDYHLLSKQYNPILWKEFDWLYLKLIGFLEEIFNKKFSWKLNCSLPGFHLFKLDEKKEYFGGSPHFDLSFCELFPHENLYKQETPHFSFTIPIKLPQNGSGLDIWDLNYSEIIKSGFKLKPEDLIESSRKMYIEYSLGDLVIFNGYHYHQIAPQTNIEKGDSRITLQGHFFLRNNTYQIYW